MSAKESYDFSDPYFEGGQIMFVKGDSSITSIEDLSGKTVAVKAGTESEKYAQSVADEYGFTIVSLQGFSHGVYRCDQWQ